MYYLYALMYLSEEHRQRKLILCSFFAYYLNINV